MLKKFDTSLNPTLTSVIDKIETSLQCIKYNQVADRITISLPHHVTFKTPENKELATKGFGICLTRSYNTEIWEVIIIIDIENCTKADLAEGEIAAVIFHELGHIVNEPELEDEPTFEYCFIHGLQFNRDVLKEVRESNYMKEEIFADSGKKINSL